MTQNETFAYLAGIIDGEGCVSIRKTFQYGKHYYYKPMIEVGMTVKSPIQLLYDIFGGSAWYEVPKNGGKWQNQHKWRVTGKGVLPVINAILPYLIVKKAQAILCIEYCKYIGKRYGQRYTPEEKIIQNNARSILFDKMHSLNHI